MSPRFFVDRPVFATVLSLVILIAGLAAMRVLPVEQYPQIVPPQVVVSATYPGASAEVAAGAVAAPIEQQINGVEGMLYMESTSSSTGAVTITVTFRIGTDADQAAINVNNRVQRAMASLPAPVVQQGVIVTKQSSSILAVVTMSSPNRHYDALFISNYALLNVVDELDRTPGVGDAKLFGEKDYSMRVWLKPDRLARFSLTPADVAAAIREQNAQFTAGRIGDEPTPANLAFTYSATTQGHLPDASAFGAIILRSNPDGSALRLADVARIELGSLDYGFSATHNGEPTVPIGIYLQPGANALEAITAVRAQMDELSRQFPEHLTYSIPFDTTQFVRLSIDEVIHTFLEAMVLVMLVVFLFLQNWRATLIPLIAVPVSIIGAFAGIYALGFSVNMLTLFGLVLAIGIVVDDAIVVLENVERLMVSENLSPRDAAIKAMSEVTTPVIAIVLVLCAVFVPVAFMGGLAGQMYKQFAVTIAVSVVISGFVALTLTPALCALILKPGHRQVAAPFRWFNRVFDRITDGYAGGVAFFLRRAAIAITLFIAMIAVTAVMFARTPSGLVPNEDQGYLFAVGILPPAASLSRTEAAMAEASTIIRSHPAVSDVISLSGLDLIGGGLKSNAGAAFITLKDWSERKGPAEDSRALAATFMGSLSGIKDALMLTFSPPPIMGMSNTGGFELYVQDRRGAGPAALMAATEKLVSAAAGRPDLAGVRTTFAIDVPQYRLDVDRDQAKALGVPIDAIFDAMQSTFGSLYVNDFTVLGRNFRVMLQSEAQYRDAIEDVRHVFVRAASGAMIPLDTFLKARRVVGPDSLGRFNGFVSAKLIGEPGPGHSSGEAIKAMEDLAAQALPEGFALAWSGAAYQEISEQGSGSTALIIGMVMVLLILAAQFERWSLPFAVILAVPFAVFGALVAISLRGLENDLYFQIGLVALIGLAAKNAILIVEFASLKQKEGLSAADAALAAARLRFRPIVMTSLAFILGCVPLAISTGVGAASRHAIGTGVIGGMLAATAIAIFFIPLFYRLIVSLRPPRSEATAAPATMQPQAPVR